jgi:hypothetical protein
MIAVPSDKLHKECIDHINTIVATSVERDEPERIVPCPSEKISAPLWPGDEAIKTIRKMAQRYRQ